MLHDYMIRKIAIYLRCENRQLVDLMSLNKRFYSIHNMFIKNLYSLYVQMQPYNSTIRQHNGWNKIHFIDLRNFRSSFDLSLLKDIHTIRFENCQSVKDISPLTNVRHLVLRFCHGFSYLSPPKSLTKLQLSFCQNITDVQSCKNIKELIIERCCHLKQISILGTGSVKILRLINMNIDNIAALQKIPSLILTNCIETPDEPNNVIHTFHDYNE